MFEAATFIHDADASRESGERDILVAYRLGCHSLTQDWLPILHGVIEGQEVA